MKNKFIAVILALTLICSSALMLASADNFKLGDVNKDTKITASDARLALRASAKLETLSEEAMLAADVNFDTRITASDARMILRASAQIDTLPEMPTEENSSADPTESTTDPTTAPSTETTTEPEPDTDIIADEYPEAIDAFFSGSFYIDAISGNDSEATPVKMAANKNGTEIVMSSGGAELSMLVLKRATYLKATSSKGEKYYVEISKELMDQFGLDFSEIIGDLSFAAIENLNKPVLTQGTYNDQKCDVYTFSNKDSSKLDFYAVGEKIVKIAVIEKDGTESTTMHINELTGKIPSNMLSIKGFKETSIFMLPTLLPEIMG